ESLGAQTFSERQVFVAPVRGEADIQFVIELLATLQFEPDILIEVATRLLFPLAKMDEADGVAFPLRLVFLALPPVFPQRAYEADLVCWFGQCVTPCGGQCFALSSAIYASASRISSCPNSCAANKPACRSKVRVRQWGQ